MKAVIKRILEGTLFLLLGMALQAPSAAIPEGAIVELEEQLEAMQALASTTEARRAGKRLIRSIESLVERYPEDVGRYRALGVAFGVQQALYVQKQSRENAEALVAIARKLQQAPDEQAEYRLDADLLLLQLTMSETDDDVGKAMAIAEMADRYRGTSGEARSLMAGCTFAFNLGHRSLLEAFRYALTRGFDQDPEVKAFLQERFASRKPIAVSGIFATADRRKVSFPKGRMHVLCFWSRDAENLEQIINEVADLQKRASGRFTVYSLNLDELADGGARILKQKEVDWVPLILEDGIDHPFYRSLGTQKLAAGLLVNPFGYASYLSSHAGQTLSLQNRYEAAAEAPDVLALWRSLLTGDFLLAGADPIAGSAIPPATMTAIRDCFVAPPLRYALNAEQELANYKKAMALCAETAAKHPADSGLWTIQTHRVIALMGVWRVTDEVLYLEEAEAIAKTLLKVPSDPQCELVSRYCVTMAALQREGARPQELAAEFRDYLNGEGASGLGEVAGLLLALEGHLPDAYVSHRDRLLARYSNDEDAGWFTSFMLHPGVSGRLFKPALPDRGSGVAVIPEFNRAFVAECDIADGKTVVVPDRSTNQITAVVCLDQPADATAQQGQDDAINYLTSVASNRPLRDMRVFVAMRSNDTGAMRTNMTARGWQCETAILPEARWNSLSRQYGVFGANKRPSVFLLKPDGSVAGAVTELAYHPRARVKPLQQEIEPLLRDIELPLLSKAIADGDYQLAVTRLHTTAPLDYRARMRHEPNWLAANRHRRKLVWCYMQLGEWERALAAITTTIEARLVHTDYIKSHIAGRKWCHLCHGHLNPFIKRILLLEELGRNDEAAEARALFKPTPCPEINDIEVLWTVVEEELSRYKTNSPRRYGSAERYLAGLERGMRRKQYLYNFDIDTDLLTQAHILTKLGRTEEVEASRINARLRAWPYEPREYDMTFTREDAQRRHSEAVGLLGQGKAQEALALLNKTLQVHEAGPKLCGFQCTDCGDQRQGLGLRAKALRTAKRNDEAAISEDMAKALKCPADDRERDSDWFFPAGRVGWGHVDVGDLGYIDEYIRGGVHAIESRRKVRFELADDLKLRAQALEQLGKKEEAARDMRRAKALVFLAGPSWRRPHPQQESAMTVPERYVDILRAERGE